MATIIRIGDASVNFATLCIDGPAGRSSMEPKVMNVLQVLVGNAGEVVSREALLEQVWSETHGGDESLSRAVSLLRRAFGDVRGSHHYIETVPKRGYRLVAEVREEAGSEIVAPDTPTATAAKIDASGSSAANLAGGRSPVARWMGLLSVLLLAAAATYLAISARQPDRVANIPTGPGTVTDVASEARPKSVAVLPFQDLSTAGDQEYFADGLAEEILNALVRFPDLRVIGRTSSFSFKDGEVDIAKVDATLSVTHLLTGSVRKQGDRVRVTARLVRTGGGQNLWSDTYDGDLNDIFELQEDIARDIARNLGLVLDLPGRDRFVPVLTENRQAYDLFLQGRALARKFGHRNKTKAKELLERAVGLDPGFADAWAWLGQTNLYLTLTASSSQIASLVGAARFAVDRSLELDPGLAIGHLFRSRILDYQLDIGESVDAVEKAYQLNPYHSLVAIRRGAYHGLIGHTRKGAEMLEEGLRWDPTDPIGLVNLGIAQQSMGRPERAIELLRRSEDLGFIPAAGQRCLVLMNSENPDAGSTCWNELPDDFRFRYSPLFQAPEQWRMLAEAIFLDNRAAQQETVAALDQYLAGPDARANAYILQLYLLVGRPDRFMQTFVERPFPFNAGALTTIWGEQEGGYALRHHPDFAAFAERIGLVRAWRKYGWPDRCRKNPGSDGSKGQFSCD